MWFKHSLQCCLSHDFLRFFKVSMCHERGVQVCKHGFLEHDTRAEAKGVKSIGEITLPEVLKAKADGFGFAVLLLK